MSSAESKYSALNIGVTHAINIISASGVCSALFLHQFPMEIQLLRLPIFRLCSSFYTRCILKQITLSTPIQTHYIHDAMLANVPNRRMIVNPDRKIHQLGPMNMDDFDSFALKNRPVDHTWSMHS